jgi:hypothetical protein
MEDARRVRGNRRARRGAGMGVLPRAGVPQRDGSFESSIPEEE